MYTNKHQLILASASPRRQQFLRDLGLCFTVVEASIVEQPEVDEEPSQFARRMALEKARAVAVRFPGTWIVSGDTVVSMGKEILGKPRDEEDAVAMLLSLAGREHLVETAFCLYHGGLAEERLHSTVTKVRFAAFGEAVARAYAATGEGLDKAGAYGIQGKGALLVRSIEGSHSNVVGLPLWELQQVLLECGVIALARLLPEQAEEC
jgi:septum formation protein